MTDSANVLEVSELRVHYGKRAAVDGLSLSLKPGETVALLGPNGAGKSTSLLAIAGAMLPSGGHVRIAGVDMAGPEATRARARVGFADQPPSLYDFFTVAEHLAFVGEARGHDDTAAQRQLLRDLGLEPIADRLCRELSFGMRQRVSLAAALVGEIDVLLLDETLNGLDPRAAKAAREVVAAAAERGVAVLMSTHLLGVAERLCRRIVIVDRGTIAADMAGAELDALLDEGPGALESLYLSVVTADEVS
ncbi:ABC transporter ATP-binding protein [Haliangium ochraceum]|uniref:ABC transporter related protein n=1 Tax=Haliangium ochraceum (strain DSM 14365 / JCM 11303 / SMP-2) TaxID=502025 RepID=D0LFY1_HALO1|nr:ABC transporter ATP-binding protein [Haliangium ochraceum]ACY14583.1 ABC transporter related protein [Haliangium ochraceum DSM 14365]